MKNRKLTNSGEWKSTGTGAPLTDYTRLVAQYRSATDGCSMLTDFMSDEVIYEALLKSENHRKKHGPSRKEKKDILDAVFTPLPESTPTLSHWEKLRAEAAAKWEQAFREREAATVTPNALADSFVQIAQMLNFMAPRISESPFNVHKRLYKGLPKLVAQLYRVARQLRSLE